MQNTMVTKLQEVAQFRHEQPEQIIAQALEIGMSKLWIDAVLSQYLKKRIPRRKAIHLLGLDLVKLAEEQRRAVQNDIKWGHNSDKVCR